MIAETIARVPMCLECLSKKTGIPEDRAQESLQHLRAFVQLHVTSGSCGSCLQIAMTYRIVDRRGSDGAAPTPYRPAIVTQSAALWDFLTRHRGEMFCTQCIAKSLSATKRIDRAVIGAEGRGARRHYGTCTSCGRERLLCGLPSA